VRDSRSALIAVQARIRVRVKKGRHTFEVRAIDRAGNVGTAATDTWKVKKKKK
jgi:hypothetical protein